jgi:hypothetical protein
MRKGIRKADLGSLRLPFGLLAVAREKVHFIVSS